MTRINVIAMPFHGRFVCCDHRQLWQPGIAMKSGSRARQLRRFIEQKHQIDRPRPSGEGAHGCAAFCATADELWSWTMRNGGGDKRSAQLLQINATPRGLTRTSKSSETPNCLQTLQSHTTVRDLSRRNGGFFFAALVVASGRQPRPCSSTPGQRSPAIQLLANANPLSMLVRMPSFG